MIDNNSRRQMNGGEYVCGCLRLGLGEWTGGREECGEEEGRKGNQSKARRMRLYIATGRKRVGVDVI